MKAIIIAFNEWAVYGDIVSPVESPLEVSNAEIIRYLTGDRRYVRDMNVLRRILDGHHDSTITLEPIGLLFITNPEIILV